MRLQGEGPGCALSSPAPRGRLTQPCASAVCAQCWKFMAIAVDVVNTILRGTGPACLCPHHPDPPVPQRTLASSTSCGCSRAAVACTAGAFPGQRGPFLVVVKSAAGSPTRGHASSRTKLGRRWPTTSLSWITKYGCCFTCGYADLSRSKLIGPPVQQDQAEGPAASQPASHLREHSSAQIREPGPSSSHLWSYLAERIDRLRRSTSCLKTRRTGARCWRSCRRRSARSGML